MSIIVKGVEMPEACAFCPCFRDDSIDGVHCYMCKATFVTYGKEDDWIWYTRPEWCPLVELPEHHGRLIDENEIIIPSLTSWADQAMVASAIQDAPTIIEAEGAE
jgi:hypothetical protein